jgi:hypothetical protein
MSVARRVAPVKVSECDDDDMIGCCLVMVITAFKSPQQQSDSVGRGRTDGDCFIYGVEIGKNADLSPG